MMGDHRLDEFLERGEIRKGFFFVTQVIGEARQLHDWLPIT